jgi:hypothetical protein
VPTASIASVNATDNCVGTVTIEVNDVITPGSCANRFSIVRTWTATDVCGNFSTSSQTITVDDQTAPVITCPSNITVTADAGQPDAVVTIDLPTVSDNCDGDVTYSNDYTGVEDASGTYNLGTTTVTYTVTDNCGNTSQCSFTVTVNDEEAPEINCPPTITVSCIDLVPAAYADYSEFVAAGGSASDNNGINEDSFALVSQTSDNNTCPETITRVYTISDNDGNSSECTQTIIVNDEINPVLTVPADDTVECDAIPELGTPTATDNCDAAVDIVYDGEVRTDGACDDTYTLTRTWTATDNCSNTHTVSQTINVQDTTDPVLTVPADDTVECDAIPEVGTPSATDNCDADVTIVYDGEVRTDGACDDTYTLTRTWTATDNCSNTHTVSQTINVQDTTNPVLTVPADDTVECDAIPEVGTPSATDNCDAAVDIVYDGEVRTDGACDDTYTLTRTWTAIDNCSNTHTVSQTINVQDTTPPSITCPANITVKADQGQPDADVTIDLPSVSDNCDGDVTYSNDYTGVEDASGTYNLGTTTVTYTVTDNCGNTSQCSFTVTVNDEEFPEINCPPTITVSCIDLVPAAYADYSEFVAAGGSASDNNGINEDSFALVSETSDNNTCPETITRVYTISDNDGNSSECTQTIIVNDEINPTASNPQPINVECIEDVPAADIAVVTDAADNCTANPVVAFVSDVSDNNTCAEIITRTYSVR